MAMRVGLTVDEPIPQVWLALMRLLHLTDDEYEAHVDSGQAFIDLLKAGTMLSLTNELSVLSDISKLQRALPADEGQQPVMLALRTAVDGMLEPWCVTFVQSFPVINKEKAAKVGRDEIAARKAVTDAKHAEVIRQFQTNQDVSFGDAATTSATWVQLVGAPPPHSTCPVPVWLHGPASSFLQPVRSVPAFSQMHRCASSNHLTHSHPRTHAPTHTLMASNQAAALLNNSHGLCGTRAILPARWPGGVQGAAPTDLKGNEYAELYVVPTPPVLTRPVARPEYAELYVVCSLAAPPAPPLQTWLTLVGHVRAAELCTVVHPSCALSSTSLK
jgi:hypothetical protein